MALYSDRYWLLSHIRNSFISTDDTVMCEIVMEGQSLPKNLVEQLNVYPDSDDSQDEEFSQSNSADIIPFDLDLSDGMRSSTALRLERMGNAKKRAAKTKLIKWEPNLVSNFTTTKKESPFIPRTNVKSLLSQQIINCANVPLNPYIKYAKFDGSAQVGIPIRKYRIFLTMLPEEQRSYPMTVACIATAKIEELIGLICFKCSTVHGDLPLKPVNKYGLYIMEEDGEVERDLGALDSKECVAKFGFNCLGLVEEINTPTSDSPQSPCEDLSSSLFPLYQPSSISNSQDANKQLSVGMELLEMHNTAMEAPFYKSYKVHLLHRLSKVEIQLGVIAEKIEIDPVRQKSNKFIFNRHKSVSHPIESIASCEIVETRSSKSVFRIVYNPSFTSGSLSSDLPTSSTNLSPTFKHYDFETNHGKAEEIVQKVNMILELRSSVSRKEYLDLQAKRNSRPKSFKELAKSNYKW